MANTWGSALVTTVVAMASAFAGAYAIGVIRPLGGKSPWLLLPFAPWLFVGTGPLALVNFEALTASESYGTFLSTAPRAWIAVPALFLLTALVWGVEERRRAMVGSGLSPEAARGASVRAAWPLTALIGIGVLLANAQDLYWQILSMAPERPTSGAVMTQAFTEYFGNADDVGVGIGYPLWLLIPFAGVAGAPSRDLAGAVTQVLSYRRTLLDEWRTLLATAPTMNAIHPKCFVVAGMYSGQIADNRDRKRSIELYRSALHDVTIITLTSFFASAQGILSVFEGSQTGVH